MTMHLITNMVVWTCVDGLKTVMVSVCNGNYAYGTIMDYFQVNFTMNNP